MTASPALATKYADTINGSDILIVDDEPLNAILLKEIFYDYSVTLRHAKNGEQALQMVEEKTPDLVLMDVMMPVMNGFDTCVRLKSDPENEHLPVIFITALADVNDKVRGLESGGVDYITKPINKAEVLARVNLHLRLQQAQLRLSEEAAECSRLSWELRKFYQAFEQAKLSIFITDAEGHIEFANQTFCQENGFNSFEVLGKKPNVMSSGLTPPEVYQNLWQTIKGGEPWQGELLNRKKDGRYSWELVSITPLFSGERQLTHFFTIETNINSQKMLEDKIRAEAQKNRLTFEQNLLAYIEWDAELLIKGWNAGAQRLFGYSAADMLGKAGLDTLVTPAQQDALRSKLLTFFDTPQAALQQTLTCVTQSGQSLNCEWRIVALSDHIGTVERIVSFISGASSTLPDEFPRFLRKHLVAILGAGRQCGDDSSNQDKYLKLICSHSEKLLRISDKLFKTGKTDNP